LGGWKILTMLLELRLKNFRGFEEHAVPLHPTTLIVGRNNAGKSSLVEALRLLSLVTTRFRALGYHEGPSWGGIPKRDYGVSPSLKGMEINFSTLFHRYGDPPAILEASFSNQTAVRIYIGSEERVHAVIFDAQGYPLRTKAAAIKLKLPAVEILPQVGPLDTNETVLSAEYVRRAASSNLASKHFRNQLKVFSDRVAEFRGMVEETWPGLRILDLQAGRGYPGERLYLNVRDEDFAAEVAAMGHGLQMWLQTMWFLARVGHAACVILDEPDVYMHPDLQRRLIRYLRTRHQQVVIATHSIEMMAEAKPEDILVVDRRRRVSRFTSDLPSVQRLIENVGSVHNIQLAKL
jgi:predicted ATPase